MQQTVEIPLSTLLTYGTLSGYIYIHIPQHLCKQFSITAKTAFIAFYKDGRLALVQQGQKKE